MGRSRHSKLVKAQPMISSKRIKEDLQLTVSTGTIRSRLGEINLPARSPRKVPLLNKRHVQKRLEFAKEHIEWPEKKWRNILWTDETFNYSFNYFHRSITLQCLAINKKVSTWI
uniref:Transposase Tc1-like domain-containing protein n=1 Tax=Astyanax mexicanus TaxID=7994 RepID=A0A3B1JF70_ASTMX